MWTVLRASSRSFGRPVLRRCETSVAPRESPSRRCFGSFPSRTSRPKFSRQLCVAAVPPLIVVLDLDECLIHSTAFSSSAEGLRQDEACRPEHASAATGVESFQASFADASTGRVASCLVLKRKGVDEFIAACCAAYETYIFTAGTKPYADAVLDKLDPERRLSGRFYRTDCNPVNTAWGHQYLKDLEAVAKRTGRSGDLSRMVLVDNNPMSFVCQPKNGILVPDFVGELDDVLPKVLRLLGSLSDEPEDVRPTLDQLFKLEESLAEIRAKLRLDSYSRL